MKELENVKPIKLDDPNEDASDNLSYLVSLHDDEVKGL